ncbi:MAG: aspartyl protease family protein [Sinobacteraceae bacterium]|nr:aspartyl protease family protein [Nevskiaceae bacterium]
MLRRSGVNPAALGGLLLLGVGLCPAASATCTLARLAEAPVVMVEMRPTVSARINGTDASFLIDSGAFFSTLSRATVAQFNLRRSPAPTQLRVRGVGGDAADLALTTVKDFTLFGVDIPNVEFLVGGSEVGANVVGILGQNVLRIADVEYDLANGVIRLMRVKGCAKSALAYWAANQPYSEMEIDWATALQPHTTGIAYLNGVKIHVMFDTGAATSVVTVRGARRAGVKTDGPDVVPAGYGFGIGRQTVRNWLAPVDSFKIGAEEIRHTHLRLADFELGAADMLIGADFFLSHRIYVASSQRRLYFTYNGGPVFDLRRLPDPAQVASTAPAESRSGEPRQAEARGDVGKQAAGTDPGATADSGAVAQPGETPQPDGAAGVRKAAEPGAPADAAAFSRRGAAFAARRDYRRAIADLTQACELNPHEPSYFFERGQVHRQNGEPALALADYDQALKLDPDYLVARVARAELHLAAHAVQRARSDLEDAERVAPRQANIRLQLGDLYAAAGQFESALRQYDLWMEFHRADFRMADALAARCRAQASLNTELDKALADCEAALRRRPDSIAFLNDQALVELRLHRLDRAIRDFDRVLHAQPQNSWALYSRGLARAEKGDKAGAQVDISAARALQPDISEVGAQHRLPAPP